MAEEVDLLQADERIANIDGRRGFGIRSNSAAWRKTSASTSTI